MQDKLIEAVAQAIWTANTYPAKGEQPDESSMNDYWRMAESAIAAVRAHDAGTDEELRKAIHILRTTPITPEHGFECGTEWGVAFSTGFGHAIKILEKASASHAAESAPACPECGHNNVHGKYGCTWTHHDGEYDSSTERCNCKKTSLASTTNRAAEPVEDVVERALKAYFEAKLPVDDDDKAFLAGMTAAGSIFNQKRDVEWEKAIRELVFKYDVSRWTTDYFITEIRTRLAPKPSLAEEMEPILTKHFKTIGVVDCAAELAALVERTTGK